VAGCLTALPPLQSPLGRSTKLKGILPTSDLKKQL